MRSQTVALLALTAATTSAIPTQIVKRDWTNDANGNVKIYFSDDTVKLGTVKIDTIMDDIATACSTDGVCDTGDIALKGQLIGSGTSSVDDITVTVSPSGAYPSWIHNGLVDALRAAVHAAANCQDVTNTPTCPNPAAYCPEQPYTVNECVVPRFWGIDYQAPDAADAAPPNMNANVQMTMDGNNYCSTFATVGSAIAGAVNGAAGGAFTLIGLACQA